MGASFFKSLVLCVTILMLGCTRMYAQNTSSDSIDVKPLHSPKKATLLALIPGAGQIYNKKYWKLPIVYAGFGVTTYFAITNGKEYSKYNSAFVCSSKADDPDDPIECSDELAQKYSTDELKSIRDYYRRNMELSYIFMGVWYILQILDATVDAHLYYWEVDENISVEWQPQFQLQPSNMALPQAQNSYNGLSIRVNF